MTLILRSGEAAAKNLAGSGGDVGAGEILDPALAGLRMT